MPPSCPRRLLRVMLLLAAVPLLFSRCDVPTSEPDFGFSTSLRTPLIFDQTFTLLGPDSSENELFSVAVTDEANQDGALGVSIPLSIRDEVTLHPVIEGDFSALSDLAGDTSSVSVQQADLRLEYTNDLPVGVEARLEVLGEDDAVLLTLPAPAEEPLALQAATATRNGTAAQAGMVTFSLSRDELLALSAGSKIRLRLTVKNLGDETVRLRSSDTIRLRLKGRFELEAHVGG